MGGFKRSVASSAAILLVSAGLLAVTPLTASAAESYWVEPTGNLTVSGRGFGHGRGMSQYGAQGAALAGRTSTQILDFYYPGTQNKALGATIVRVHVTADTTAGVKVLATTGLRARDLGSNAVWTLPVQSTISQWEIRPHLSSQTRLYYYRTGSSTGVLWRTLSGMAQFEGPAVTRLVMPSGSSVPYRGTLRAADRSGADLDTINVVSIDYYLRGVVPKEAITSWRPAALQAQAVAARTFAASKLGSHSDYDLCDTISCQVYGGYAAEVASTNAAVVATSNRIRTYNGNPILAEFSSSNGGYTTPSSVPYQVGKADPYDGYSGNGNPNTSWTASVSRTTAQARFAVGTIKQLSVLSRNGLGTWGGRVLTLRVVGTSSTKTFTGDQVRSLLGLKSTWIRFNQSRIMQRWVAIGGATSPVGVSLGYEWPVRGGTGQTFSKGHIYRTASYGAVEIYPGFETRYQAIGGPNHTLGLPIAPRSAGARPGSQLQRFGNGRMWYSAATGVREVSGRIYTAYYGAGLEGGRLGLPVSYQYSVTFSTTAGAQQRFQGGYINWYASNNTTAVVYT
ncbi:MAG TPA: SpoIID/LytB domain-containing protein [Kribbellaceae bacterium]|nr:SpoIID/LytB domain-containing protein [Kribbellaceae bacterium]